ncbi:serine/threonine-protein kinase Nek8 [Sarcophilus harrisii]|uniref:serine/threonine-protein kinase Nek8 n=1 Tax=Sarcophilus harrisii TaxID=9305 RepID=UPI001301AED5|nr:serine/threonine-protein kinase Nek8 [Sarcophilus harrisii]
MGNTGSSLKRFGSIRHQGLESGGGEARRGGRGPTAWDCAPPQLRGGGRPQAEVCACVVRPPTAPPRLPEARGRHGEVRADPGGGERRLRSSSRKSRPRFRPLLPTRNRAGHEVPPLGRVPFWPRLSRLRHAPSRALCGTPPPPRLRLRMSVLNIGTGLGQGHQAVIIKQIPVEQMTKDERLAAQNECQVLKLLNHPNVIEYYENFLEDKALMIAWEPRGTPEYIQSRTALDEETILHFFVQILLALHHGHPISCTPKNPASYGAGSGFLRRAPASPRPFLARGTFQTLWFRPHFTEQNWGSARRGPGLEPGQILAHAPPSAGLGSLCTCRVEKPLGRVPTLPCGRAGGRAGGPRTRGGPQGLPRPAIPPPLSSVYTWGGGLSTPTRLPMLNTEVVQVSAGRTQKAGVTRSGRLIMWEAPPMGVGGGVLLPGALEQHQPQFVSRFLEGQSGVTIKHVACGDLFTACLTDRGIIMTFGSGSNGCLGHGSFTDLSQPTIVEALLGYEMVQVACGASHVLALSTERELFAWGRGDGGRLGLGTRESHSSPQQVPVPPEQEAQWVVCGIDSSMILTVPGRALACGSNRFNKLGLDRVSPGEEPAPHDQVEEALSFMPLGSVPLDSEPLVSVDVGTAHSAAVTASGECYTFGSNQHGQLGTSARRGSRAPCLVAGLEGTKVVMVACGDAFTVAIGAEGDVYTWGKGARGRLGRKDEDAGLPRPVQLDEAQPYTVTSVSCCHGNTLLAIRPTTEESIPP